MTGAATGVTSGAPQPSTGSGKSALERFAAVAVCAAKMFICAIIDACVAGKLASMTNPVSPVMGGRLMKASALVVMAGVNNEVVASGRGAMLSAGQAGPSPNHVASRAVAVAMPGVSG